MAVAIKATRFQTTAMNAKSFFPTAALVLVVACAGCNKSGKLSEPSTQPTPAGPVELKLKWIKGERVVQNLDMKQKMTMNIPGQPAPVEQNVTMGQKYALTVLNADANGGHEVEMEFLSARMGMQMGGKTMMNYDSEKHSSTDKKNPVADVFSKVVGAKVRYFLDASNNVVRMEGVEELGSRLAAGSQDATAASLKSMYSEGYFKQMMSASRFLPPKAVQPGDTWPVQLEFPMGGFGTMVMNFNFTLAKWEMHGKRNCARMEFQGTITTKPDTNSTDTNSSPTGMTMSIPDGNTSGVSWFDPELGITIDTTMNQDMTLAMSFPRNPRAKPGPSNPTMTMTNQMNQVLNIKLDSVN